MKRDESVLGEIRADIKEMKQLQVKQLEQQAVHNHILQEHHRRSTNLEDRIVPLEADLVGRAKLKALLLGSGGIIGILGVAIAIWKTLSGH